MPHANHQGEPGDTGTGGSQAKRIMDAAWPEYGGNHQSAEFWQAFSEGVTFALASAPTPPDRVGEEVGRETLETIAAWCEQTFGPVEPARVAKRAAEEMDELLAEPTKVEEAADVVIVLSRYPGLWGAVERKMAVNRARKWRLMGDGTGYHVKAPSDAPSTTEADR